MPLTLVVGVTKAHFFSTITDVADLVYGKKPNFLGDSNLRQELIKCNKKVQKMNLFIDL